MCACENGSQKKNVPTLEVIPGATGSQAWRVLAIRASAGVGGGGGGGRGGGGSGGDTTSYTYVPP